MLIFQQVQYSIYSDLRKSCKFDFILYLEDLSTYSGIFDQVLRKI
jgi:hypothetical protein